MKQMTIPIHKQNFANIMVIFLLCISSDDSESLCPNSTLHYSDIQWDELLYDDKTNFHHSLAIIVNCHQLCYNNRRTFVGTLKVKKKTSMAP